MLPQHPVDRGYTPLPAADAMSPGLVPAEIMTADAAPVWDRVILADGQPVSDRPIAGRVALAEMRPHAPQPVPHNDARATAIAEAIAPGTRLVRSADTAHVFQDMSVPRPVTTEWTLVGSKPAVERGRAGEEPELLLPASKPVMREMGLRYEIVDHETGDVAGNAQDEAFLAYYRARRSRSQM